MKIHYKDADGKITELEVSPEVGSFYLASVEAEKSNDRRNTRPDRHSPLSAFDYEGAAFADDVDVERDALRRISAEALRHAIDRLPQGQRELVLKVYFEGRSLVSIAAEEGVSHVAIIHRLERIKKNLKKILK